jgi:ketosteroid isomerase-like protein
MSTPSLEAAVRELADREAIRDLARRYADCVWRKDFPGAVELFSEDGVMDTGDRPPIRGRAALLEAYQGMVGDADFQPFVHNHVIELQGDHATGRCYLDLRGSRDGRSMIGAGYYDDEYVRVGGEWKFRSRKLTMCHFVPLSQGWVESESETQLGESGAIERSEA